jgi:hypothetical protein
LSDKLGQIARGIVSERFAVGVNCDRSKVAKNRQLSCERAVLGLFRDQYGLMFMCFRSRRPGRHLPWDFPKLQWILHYMVLDVEKSECTPSRVAIQRETAARERR